MPITARCRGSRSEGASPFLDQLLCPVALGAKEDRADRQAERSARKVGDEIDSGFASPRELRVEIPADVPAREQPRRQREAAVEEDEPQEAADAHVRDEID